MAAQDSGNTEDKNSGNVGKEHSGGVAELSPRPAQPRRVLVIGAVCTKCGKNAQMSGKSICASCWMTVLLLLGQLVNEPERGAETTTVE